MAHFYSGAWPTFSSELTNGLAYTVDTSGVIAVAHSDGLGSVRALSDASGAVVQTYQTDEFGIPLAAGTQGSQTQPFGFTGEQRDAETGFSYLRARYYDPQVGRFPSRDPLGPKDCFLDDPLRLNFYSYTENNPINRRDVAGLSSSRVVGGTVVAPLAPPATGRVSSQVRLGGIGGPCQWVPVGPVTFCIPSQSTNGGTTPQVSDCTRAYGYCVQCCMTRYFENIEFDAAANCGDECRDCRDNWCNQGRTCEDREPFGVLYGCWRDPASLRRRPPTDALVGSAWWPRPSRRRI